MKLKDYEATLDNIQVSEEKRNQIKKELLNPEKLISVTIEKRPIFTRRLAVPLIAGFGFLLIEIIVLSLFVNRQNSDDYLTAAINTSDSDTSVSSAIFNEFPGISSTSSTPEVTTATNNIFNDYEENFPFDETYDIDDDWASELAESLNKYNNYESIFKNNESFFIESTPLSKEQLLEKLYDEPVLKNLEFDNIKDFDISLLSSNIEVKRSKDNDKITIEYYEWTENEFLSEIQDNRLTFKYNNQYYLKEKNSSQGNWVDYLLKDQGKAVNPDYPQSDSRIISVIIPDDVNLNINHTSGCAELTDYNAEKFTYNSASGILDLKNCNIKTSELNTASGIISVEKSSINSFDINIASGNYASANSEFSDFNLDIASGTVIISNDKINNAEISITSGNYYSENCNFNKLKLNNVSGDINITGGSANEIELSTHSGYVVLSDISNVEKYIFSVFSSDIDLTLNDSVWSDYKIDYNHNVYVNNVKIEDKEKNKTNGQNRVIEFESYSGNLYITS